MASNGDHDEEENKFAFVPPLYKQRDDFVLNFLSSENVKSVLDLGCGECRFLRKLRRLASIEKIVGIEKLEYLISNKEQSLRPLIYDYLCKRSKPLDIALYCGDITMFDRRLCYFDATVLIEVIEHLETKELETLPETLFGAMLPRLVIMTTPNIEFNVCFNTNKLRHWDHKFEWTRDQFRQWCSSICGRYSYSVSFSGVGSPPNSLSLIGPCTQIAIFKKCDYFDENPRKLSDRCIHSLDTMTQEFNLVCNISYPWIGSVET